MIFKTARAKREERSGWNTRFALWPTRIGDRIIWLGFYYWRLAHRVGFTPQGQAAQSGYTEYREYFISANDIQNDYHVFRSRFHYTGHGALNYPSRATIQWHKSIPEKDRLHVVNN